MHIVVVPGTNRSGSLSRRLAGLVVDDYQELGHSTDLLDLADMGPEFLDPGAYKQPQQAITDMVQRFLAADGVVFIVPEYNGSFPGVAKLFIDMLPYPEGFEARPCAYIGLSAGQFKGLRAVEALMMVAGYRNAHNFPRRVFIGESFAQFDDDGELIDEKLAERLKQQAGGFCAYIESLRLSAEQQS